MLQDKYVICEIKRVSQNEKYLCEDIFLAQILAGLADYYSDCYSDCCYSIDLL